jgi:hypothetical protein
MSSNDYMEVDTDHGHGLRGMNDNSEVHESRGNKGGSHGDNENEREQLQQEQAKKLDCHRKQSRNSNAANKGAGSNNSHGLRGTNDNSEGHGTRGNKGG